MVYLDTNILIYASVEQDAYKKETSLKILEDLIENNQLALSTLALQEFIFTMAKLGIDNKIIKNDSDFYFNFVNIEYDHTTLKKAMECCTSHNFCKNINDVVHLYLAEKSKYKKLLTFDSDFKKLAPLSDIRLEIL